MKKLNKPILINGGDPLSTSTSSNLYTRELYIDTNGYLFTGTRGLTGVSSSQVTPPMYVLTDSRSRGQFATIPDTISTTIDTPQFAFNLQSQTGVLSSIGPLYIRAGGNDSVGGGSGSRDTFVLTGVQRPLPSGQADTFQNRRYYGAITKTELMDVRMSNFHINGNSSTVTSVLSKGNAISISSDGCEIKNSLLSNSYLNECTNGSIYLREGASYSYGTALPTATRNDVGRLFFKLV